MAKKAVSTEGQVIQLDPARILAEDNIRFGLLAHRVDAMAESILERGGVMIPVEVQALPAVVNGFTHKLTAGFIRHAAVLKLNTEQAAGLPIPAIVYSPADELDRLMRQVTENNQRENLSPMDRAVAIQKMEAAGVTRAEVARAFAVPGGRKGLAMQPASNSTLNMHLSFLELPKAMQAKIHDGRIPVSAAYQLTRVPKEEQEAILASAEANRLKLMDKEEAQATKEGKAAERAAGSDAKLAAVTEKLTLAEQANIDAAAILVTANEHAKQERAVGPDETRLGLSFDEWPEEEKKAKAERIGLAKAAKRTAEKAVAKAQKDLANAQIAHRKVAEPEPKEAKPVKAAAAKVKKATVSDKDVKQAAAAAGVKGSKPVVLSAADAKAAATLLSKSRLSKVAAIGKILCKVLCGELTAAKAETELSLVTGERVTKTA